MSRDLAADIFVPLVFPAWLRWGQRQGAFIERDGIQKTCGWCRGPFPARRSSWCSDLCSGAFYRVWNWGAVRAYVIARDGARCTHCGAEHPGWHQDPWGAAYIGSDRRVMIRQCLGLSYSADLTPWRHIASPLIEQPWEVDHVMPVSLGGTDDPANLRTLCHACHAIETKALKGMLAKAKRRAERGIPNARVVPPG